MASGPLSRSPAVRAQAIAIEQLLTQFAILGLHHEGLVGRAIQANDPGLLVLVPDGGLEVVTESGDLVIFGHLERERLGFEQQVLRELRRQGRHLGIDVGDLLLDFRRQRRAGANKITIP